MLLSKKPVIFFIKNSCPPIFSILIVYLSMTIINNLVSVYIVKDLGLLQRNIFLLIGCKSYILLFHISAI